MTPPTRRGRTSTEPSTDPLSVHRGRWEGGCPQPARRLLRIRPTACRLGVVEVVPVSTDHVGATTDVGPDYCNEVLLRGRLAAAAESRELPSGDLLVTFRVIVDRARADGERLRVDTIDCTAWTARVQRSAVAWQPGDRVEVGGSLRRRFRRAAEGATSRVEVEVRRARRLR